MSREFASRMESILGFPPLQFACQHKQRFSTERRQEASSSISRSLSKSLESCLPILAHQRYHTVHLLINLQRARRQTRLISDHERRNAIRPAGHAEGRPSAYVRDGRGRIQEYRGLQAAVHDHKDFHGTKWWVALMYILTH